MLRAKCDPLAAPEVALFLEKVPARFRDLYQVWFRTGWRPSEIVALRFEWLDFERQEATLRKGRIPRRGGLEAPPKTGERTVDCGYDAAIFAAFERRRRASLGIGRRDYAFADEAGKPLSQEWLHKRIWLPTLRVAGLRERGQYNIRDTFITLALSAGEDPGWVAAACGTSEQMIFRHYRKWMPSARRTDGGAVARVFADPAGHQMGTKRTIRARKPG
jgi:integrase